MPNHIHFAVDGVPIPQGSMRAFNNRIVHVKGKELKVWREAIGLEAREHLTAPIKGGVSLDIMFMLPRPKSVLRQLPHVKPDLDKLTRAVFDALAGIAYLDDSQVISVTASKHYAISGAVGVQIEVWQGWPL